MIKNIKLCIRKMDNLPTEEISASNVEKLSEQHTTINLSPQQPHKSEENNQLKQKNITLNFNLSYFKTFDAISRIVLVLSIFSKFAIYSAIYFIFFFDALDFVFCGMH